LVRQKKKTKRKARKLPREQIAGKAHRLGEGAGNRQGAEQKKG